MKNNNNEVSVVQRSNTLPAMRQDAIEAHVIPSADVYETPDAYTISLDMPGARRESITITLEPGELVVKAPVPSYHKERVTLLRQELRGTGYRRVFRIGDGIDRNSVDARFEDGVLTISLFKKEELKPREIKIH